MKKILLLLLLSSINSVFSQAPRGFYGTAGINSSDVKSEYFTTEPGYGYNFGLIFSMGYHESYNFQIDLLFTQKSVNFYELDETFENPSTNNYIYGGIEAGFYANYYILRPDEDKLFIGPQFGFNLSSLGKMVSKSENNKDLLPYLINSNELLDVTKLNFSTGFGITGGFNRIKFDLRYNLGLTNVFSYVETNSYDETNSYTGPTVNGKLNTISLNVSYLIFKRIKKR